MRPFVSSILKDSLQHIRNIQGNDKEKFFLLYDNFLLFLAQLAREYAFESFECRIDSFALFTALCDHTELPDHLRFAGFKLLRQKNQSKSADWKEDYDILYWTVVEIGAFLTEDSILQEWTREAFFPPDKFWKKQAQKCPEKVEKVVLTGKKKEGSGILHGYWVDQNGQQVTIRTDEMMRIKNQVIALEKLDETYFPVTVHLFDAKEKDNVLYPTAMVLSPDHLVDITSIANCFTPFGESLTTYLMEKITPFRQSHHLLIGNCINTLLDELVHDPDLKWEEAVNRLFRNNEMQWATYDNREIRDYVEKIREHFYHLKYTFEIEFPKIKVDPRYFAVEPSFYSPTYGLQGRLDLLYESPIPDDHKTIIELKSGKIFKPNSYGLNPSHYLQTILYDLLIRSAYPENPDPVNYILYSSEAENNLRHAPAIRDWQYEALGVRNQLIIMEWQLAHRTKNKTTIYQLLKSLDEHLTGFLEKDRSEFFRLYETATPLAQSYFDEFLKFLSREQITAKLGLFTSDRKGQSQLWASSSENKDQQYLLLSGLAVSEDRSDEEDSIVIFQKTDITNPLANFRKGDVILAYPAARKDHPEQGEIFRCTLTENVADRVSIRLRARQHRSIFQPGTIWYIEHDHLDSSHRYMSQGLRSILEMNKEEAGIYLGILPPKSSAASIENPIPKDALVGNQNQILHKMHLMQDYFLLWGPPGTGKTSVMLKEYVRDQTLKYPKSRILLLGHTNRAVDEICAAVTSLSHLDVDRIIRIGSRYGTDPQYHPLLWKVKARQCKSRADVAEILESSRVICATLASLTGQSDLFDLISFSKIVIDEASQILEPAILPILSRGIPYILIGDHRQLPAVITQPEEDTQTENTTLHEIGLFSLGNSYFERMFLRSYKENWTGAFGILKHQGRMHKDLMFYPNMHFYKNILSTLPGKRDFQHKTLSGSPLPADPDWQTLLKNSRTVFIPTRERNIINYKINREEAFKTTQITDYLIKTRPDIPFSEIGIITPYRAQISTIRNAMEKAGISSEEITVDTVERYQGGAKSIIIISYCINSPAQIQFLKESMLDGNIDRKLNVALTRAREQIIFLGNAELMETLPLYKALIDHYQKAEMIV